MLGPVCALLWMTTCEVLYYLNLPPDAVCVLYKFTLGEKVDFILVLTLICTLTIVLKSVCYSG